MIELIKKAWEFDPETVIGMGGLILVFLMIIGVHIWEIRNDNKN